MRLVAPMALHNFTATQLRAFLGVPYSEQTYITGTLVTKHTAANTIDISAGSFFDPSSNKVVNHTGASALAVGSLGVSQWNQVFGYESAPGTVSWEVTNNADPPSTTYAGTARQGGTNINRRWLGCFLTTAASAIYDFNLAETGANELTLTWLANVGAAPFRVLSAGTATSYGSITSVAGAVPKYVAPLMNCRPVIGLATTAVAQSQIELSLDATNTCSGFESYIATTTSFSLTFLFCPVVTATPGIYYRMTAGTGGAGATGYLDVSGCRIVR